MLRRSGLEQLLGCMRMCLFVSASGASGQIYRLRKARAQAESGASEGNRDAKRQVMESLGLQTSCDSEFTEGDRSGSVDRSEHQKIYQAKWSTLALCTRSY